MRFTGQTALLGQRAGRRTDAAAINSSISVFNRIDLCLSVALSAFSALRARTDVVLDADGGPLWLRHLHLHEVTGDPEALRRAEHVVRSGPATGASAPMVDRAIAFDDVTAART